MIYTDWPMEDYQRDPSISRSDICRVLISPAHYLVKPKRRSAAMVFGSAFHLATLQPDAYARCVRVIPAGLRKGTRAYDAYCDLHPGATEEISESDDAAIRGMRDSVLCHPVAGQWLRPAIESRHVEESYIWDDQENGLACKCRPDARCSNVIIDLKSAQDARPKAFSRAVHSYGYHIQDVHYCLGAESVYGEPFAMRFIVVEKEPPYAVAIYDLDEEAVLVGARERKRGLALIAACAETGCWPSYPQDVQVVNLPAWAE